MRSYRLSNQVTAAHLASKSFLLSIGVFVVLTCTVAISSFGQSLGKAGTIKGTVVDPSGAVVRSANVTVTNPITGYTRSTNAEDDGTFTLSDIPSNQYHLEISAPGFCDLHAGRDKGHPFIMRAQELVNVEAGGLRFSKLIPRFTSMLIGEPSLASLSYL